VIFEGTPPDVPDQTDAALPCVSVEMTLDGVLEALRLEQRRALSAAMTTPHPVSKATIPIATLRRSSLPQGVILLFDVETGPANDQPLERSLGCVYAELDAMAWPRRHALLRRRLAGILQGLLAAVAPTLEALQRRQREAIETRYVDARRRVLHRQAAVMAFQQSTARQLVQAGLFDRRPERGHGIDAGSLFEEHDHHADGPDALMSSGSLRAVLLVDRRR
jgi:hypothetical protein